uniref:Ubiquinol-cytochrome c reductase subunit 10 n=1 Tax=Kwoniella dejecticola CBS 10117 TaxID=1296121 RepID=A0A1A5ZZF6_9TREE|nr:ubiquinol-cytochrome c reductase subunit 10 [Kwoniella dejecticola CBS 10117]OBR83170.1 ubiquinol-cytochrome c reductase subunit 10 [Kwoniella dejecticola CBS 10117]
MPAFLRRSQIGLNGITPERLRGWTTPLMIWGVAAGGAVSLFLSDVPLFRKDVLIKVPVVGNYFIDKTPDSDKPF